LAAPGDTTAAVIGAGFAGAAHVEALRRIPRVHVVAIAASSVEGAAAAATRLGIERSSGDYRELLDDPAIDVIHTCVPNDLHVDVNLAALDAGKHVLSEKPLGLDADESGRLVAAAARAPGVTGVCFNYRHYPIVAEVRERLSHGPAPHLVQGTYLQDWLLADTDWNWRIEPERAGVARALGDIGSHWIDLIQHVTGRRVVRVCGRTGRLHETRRRPAARTLTFESGAGSAEPVQVRTEDHATVLLELDGGCHGVLTVSQVSPGMRNRLSFHVDTADAAYLWNQERPNRLWIGRRDRPSEEVVRDPLLLSAPAARLTHYPAGHQEGWPDALRNLIEDFYSSIRDPARGGTVATFADAHAVTVAIEAIVRSAEEGRWVDVPAVGEEAAS
jgi:predicted dehydrogenase